MTRGNTVLRGRKYALGLLILKEILLFGLDLLLFALVTAIYYLLFFISYLFIPSKVMP